MENLDFNDYQNLINKTKVTFKNNRDMQADVGLGLAGESGEVADIIKKNLNNTKNLDLTHLKEELGDVLYYIVEACNCFEISLEEVVKLNIKKVKARHPNCF